MIRAVFRSLFLRRHHGVPVPPITAPERDRAFRESVAEVPPGRSGACVCDACIVHIWRPRWVALDAEVTP